MDLTKSMETLTASADAANEAAETALLASEGVIALSSRVSDDIRNTVRQAIQEAASQPAPQVEQEVEEAPESPLKVYAPLIAATLTLAGVGYLAVQNMTLSEQLEKQQQNVAALDEMLQINSGEAGSHVMLLAEQSQRIEEAIKAMEQKIGAPPAAPDNSAQIAVLEQLTLKVDQLQVALEQQAQQQSTVTIAAAEPSPEVAAPAASAAITLEAMRSTLKEEITPLHQTLKSVETQLAQQAVQQAQPVVEKIESKPLSYNRKKEKKKSSKAKLYRFP